MSVIRGVKDRRFKFVQLLNDMFDDSNISLKAKGFIGHCLTKPSDWKFYVKQLCSNLKEGERAIYSVINECIDNGYAYRFQPRTENGDFLPWETVVSDSKYEIEQIKKEIESSPGFKKCLAHRRFADAQTADAQNVPPTNTCSLEIRKEQQQKNKEKASLESPSSAVVFPSEEKERQPSVAPIDPSQCSWHNPPGICAPSAPVQRVGNSGQLKSKIYPCLEKIEIPEVDKIEITARYTEEIVVNALNFTLGTKKESIQCLAAFLKAACKKGLSKKDLSPPKMSTFDELKLYFKHGEFYKEAECYLTGDYLSFRRGHKQETVNLDKFFSWSKIQSLCDSFGIKFNRDRSLK
jgi:hypothetical protein